MHTRYSPATENCIMQQPLEQCQGESYRLATHSPLGSSFEDPCKKRGWLYITRLHNITDTMQTCMGNVNKLLINGLIG